MKSAKVLEYSDTKNVGRPILFFIHGWPDSGALWKKQVDFFSHQFRCVCVTLPGFGSVDEAGGDFPELVERLAATIREVAGDSKRVTLVGHDWGAYLIYLIDRKHPELSDRLVTLDVGGHFEPKTLGHFLFRVSYQWFLIGNFFLGKLVPAAGNFFTRKFAEFARVPAPATVRSRMNYPYFYFWRARFFKKYAAALPVGYRPSRPILYLYGAGKKYHFHSPKWEAIVNASPGSQFLGIKKGQHWFLAKKQAEETNQIINQWLSGGENDPAQSGK